MSQDDEPAALGFQRRQPGTSGWAIAALLCSTAVFCPPLTVLGPLLGVRALFHVSAVPGRKGRHLALGAIVVGSLATIGWAAAAIWWNGHVRRPILEGPRVPLQAGFRGDVAAFKAGFEDASVPDAEAIEFLTTLSDRYGAFLDLTVRQRPRSDGPVMRSGRVQVPYTLEFTGGTLDAEAQFIVLEQGGPGFVLRFAWLVVFDEQQGRLAYPASALSEIDAGDGRSGR